MYIREKVIKILKIKNIISSIIGMFLIAVSTAIMVSLISYYWGDWDTIIHAKATPESVIWSIVGMVLLVSASISKNMIEDAYFYSSYFEGDLDGYIKYSELSEITGKSISSVKRQLHCLRRIYMKNYEIKVADSIKQIVLYSKQCTCECRKCGAIIEKRVYFTGVCSYCGGSDLFAKILTDNRFYSIGHHMTDERKKPEFYFAEYLPMRKALFLCCLILGLSVSCIAAIGFAEQIIKYNDQEYLTKLLMSGKSYSSYELLKSGIMENIIWIFVLIMAMLPLVCNMSKRLQYIRITDECSQFFSQCKKPFVEAAKLPVLQHKANKKHGIRTVKGAICRHYLLNCSFEKHDKVLKVALARKIVKDGCPFCGAPIVGAVDVNYKCRYCANIIMGVVHKK